MPSLEDIVNSSENREVKRALSVKMVLLGFKTEDICALLSYKGGTGFLTEDHRYEIICYLRSKTHCSVEELSDYIERRFGVVYKSKQSYYDLLKEARLSWHEAQANNPKRDEARVPQKREESKNN